MYIKIKNISDSKLFLDLTEGRYTIGMQTPTLRIGGVDYTLTHTEVIEEYDAMDYKIEEMVERFKTIHEVLREEKWYEGY